MSFFIVLALIVTIAVLSIPFGRDSRTVRDRFDHGWEADLRAVRDRERAARERAAQDWPKPARPSRGNGESGRTGDDRGTEESGEGRAAAGAEPETESDDIGPT
jgi:hypothetical protein